MTVFYDLWQAANNINLCPIAQIDDPEVMSWAAEWLEMLIEMVAPGLVTPARRILLNDALKNLAASTTCAAERTLIRAAVTYSTETMTTSITLHSTFSRLLLSLNGKKLLRLFSLTYSSRFRSWLKTFRKLNCAVVLDTQSIADVVNITIRDAVFESCPTKILLVNPDAKGSKIGEFYRDFLQLNERQVNLISHMIRKSSGTQRTLRAVMALSNGSKNVSCRTGLTLERKLTALLMLNFYAKNGEITSMHKVLRPLNVFLVALFVFISAPTQAWRL